MIPMLSLIAGELDLGNFEPPVEAFAPEIGPKDTSAFAEPFVKFLSNFIGFLTTLAGLMFLIYFIFAGLSWISSGGDKGKVENAKNQMTQAAIGLVVVIAAYGITGVVGRVLGIDILNPIDVLKTLSPTGN